MRIGRSGMALAAVCGCGLAACATISPESRAAALGPVDLALTTPKAELQDAANAGSAAAQYAYSIVLEHGLGASPSLSEAALWRRKALAPRGYTQVTSYTAAFNGRPSRVNIIPLPRYDLSSVEAALVEQCVAVLAGRTAALSGKAADVCGGATNFSRLAALWQGFASSNGQRPR